MSGEYALSACLGAMNYSYLKRKSTVKKPSGMQDEFDKAIEQTVAPKNILPLAMSRSVERLGLNCDESDLKALINAVINSEHGEINIDLDIPCSFGTTKEDVQSTITIIFDDLKCTIKEVGTEITEALPQAVQITLEKMADLVGGELLSKAMEHTEYLGKVQELRASTVEKLWRKAVNQLDMLRHLVVEWDGAAFEIKSGPYANVNTALALNRIVLRLYSVAGEIIALARAGYAGGALARWRTIHEICIIAIFLSKQSDRCAQMYLAHSIIDELRLVESGSREGGHKSNNKGDQQYLISLKKQRSKLVEIFGPSFAKDLGWAAVELGRTRVTFREIEDFVEMGMLRKGYQHASSATHGGALAALTRISLGMDIEYAGEVSPAFGCEVAIDYVAGSLSTLIAELCVETESADLLIMNMVIQDFSSSVRNYIGISKTNISRITPRAKFQFNKSQNSLINTRKGKKK